MHVRTCLQKQLDRTKPTLLRRNHQSCPPFPVRDVDLCAGSKKRSHAVLMPPRRCIYQCRSAILAPMIDIRSTVQQQHHNVCRALLTMRQHKAPVNC